MVGQKVQGQKQICGNIINMAVGQQSFSFNFGKFTAMIIYFSAFRGIIVSGLPGAHSILFRYLGCYHICALT